MDADGGENNPHRPDPGGEILAYDLTAVLVYGKTAWPWVWTVGVIFSAISIHIGIMNLFSQGAGALLGIIIAAIILYYLFQPQVKAYFGKT